VLLMRSEPHQMSVGAGSSVDTPNTSQPHSTTNREEMERRTATG
jgi:hypothetical protein